METKRINDRQLSIIDSSGQDIGFIDGTVPGVSSFYPSPYAYYNADELEFIVKELDKLDGHTPEIPDEPRACPIQKR